MNESFNVGDEVRSSEDTTHGLIGKIISLTSCTAEVDFPGWIGGHNGSSEIPVNSRWNVSINRLELVRPFINSKKGDNNANK